MSSPSPTRPSFRRPPRTALAAALTAGTLSLGLVSAPAVAADVDWEALRVVRETLLVESPLVATFVQTYVPAGFTSGEEESGRLLLGLPTCLRWDYEEPYDRSYLLCEQTVWAWSPDEPVGDRLTDVSRDEAGLDFLLLSVERLSERYAVESRTIDDTVHLALTPHTDDAAFTRAWIVLDRASARPNEIAYRDREGNETRFVLSDFAPLEDASQLAPPDTIDWIDG